MQLLEAGEINALTTNAMAAKAGVSIGMLYQYFDSKHALLDALVARELRAMADKIVDSVKRETPTSPGGRNRFHRLLIIMRRSAHQADVWRRCTRN